MLLSEQRQSDAQSKRLSVENSSVGEERSDRMTLDPATRDQVLATVPNLRAFAISLSGNIDRADDLVQETLLRAITHIDSFKRGTNMPAWLITILRNLFLEEARKRQREVQDPDGHHAETLVSYPEQTGRIELGELRAALAKLPVEQCEALLLVGASDFSYDDAAAICGCATGTIRSRVHRARTRLANLLAIDSADNFWRDRATLAARAVGEQLVQRKFA
jgi:RNA polymerase sigma-70 factor, ECF subfamily